MDNDQRYINIPYPILRRKDLSGNAKMIYGFIGGFWSGDCKASNKYIGTVIGASARSVTRAVKELRIKRLIIRIPVMEKGMQIGSILKLTKDE